MRFNHVSRSRLPGRLARRFCSVISLFANVDIRDLSANGRLSTEGNRRKIILVRNLPPPSHPGEPTVDVANFIPPRGFPYLRAYGPLSVRDA